MVEKAKAGAETGGNKRRFKEKKKQRATFPSLPEDKLREFVLAVADGRVFTSADIPKGQEAHLLQMIFMPIAFGAFADVRRADLKRIGVLWEFIDKAGPRGINGYPMFMSCRVLNRSDWDRARTAIAAELDRRKRIEV